MSHAIIGLNLGTLPTSSVGPDISGSITSLTVCSGTQALCNGMAYLSASFFAGTGSTGQITSNLALSGNVIFLQGFVVGGSVSQVFFECPVEFDGHTLFTNPVSIQGATLTVNGGLFLTGTLATQSPLNVNTLLSSIFAGGLTIAGTTVTNGTLLAQANTIFNGSQTGNGPQVLGTSGYGGATITGNNNPPLYSVTGSSYIEVDTSVAVGGNFNLEIPGGIANAGRVWKVVNLDQDSSTARQCSIIGQSAFTYGYICSSSLQCNKVSNLAGQLQGQGKHTVYIQVDSGGNLRLS